MSFDEIVEHLYSNLDSRDLIEIQGRTESDMRALHHSFGRWIRNTYGLWDSTHPLTTQWHTDASSHNIIEGVDHSDDHPDAVSNDILAALWRKCKPAAGVVPQ